MLCPSIDCVLATPLLQTEQDLELVSRTLSAVCHCCIAQSHRSYLLLCSKNYTLSIYILDLLFVGSDVNDGVQAAPYTVLSRASTTPHS